MTTTLPALMLRGTQAKTNVGQKLLASATDASAAHKQSAAL
jgi:hypothetical protein